MAVSCTQKLRNTAHASSYRFREARVLTYLDAGALVILTFCSTLVNMTHIGNLQSQAPLSIAVENTSQSHNYVYSPYNVDLAMNMLYFGTDGNTHEQLQKQYFDGVDPSSALVLLPKEADESKLVALSAARLFVDENLNLSENKVFDEFKKVMKEKFDAEPHPLNFTDVSAHVEINNWVEEKTANHIKDLVPATALNGMTKLVLVSALYFKGPWYYQYMSQLPDKSDTTFFSLNENGETVKQDVKYMQVAHDCLRQPFYGHKIVNSVDIGDVTVFEVPYQNPIYSLILYMPSNSLKIHELNNLMQAHPNLLNEWTQQMENDKETHVMRAKVVHKMPFFRIDAAGSIPLSKAFDAMGVKDAFSPAAANLSKITGDRTLFVDEVYHKTFIDVNDKGTEAAAATAVAIAMRFAPQTSKTITFETNSPFVFQVRCRHAKDGEDRMKSPRTDDIVLFSGKITDVLSLQKPE